MDNGRSIIVSREKIRKSGGKRQIARTLEERYSPFFQIKAVYFTDGSDSAFVNNVKVDMGYCSYEQDGTMMVAIPALELLYSPIIHTEAQEDGITLFYEDQKVKAMPGSDLFQCGEKAIQAEQATQTKEGVLYVDVETLMTKCLGKVAVWEETYLAPGTYLGIGESEEDLFQTPDVIKDMIIQSNKKSGLLLRGYYFEKARRIMPYSLYVPTSYEKREKPFRLAVWLHGAGSGAADLFDWKRAGAQFAELAEAHHMILLFPDGYSLGFYGGASPELHPESCSEEEKKYLELCESEPLTILSRICKEYDVDTDNVFLFGNSMGGGGTFYLGLHYPGKFRAIAPCGALTTQNIDSYDVRNLEHVPVMLVCGTENIGYDNMPGITENLCRRGVLAELVSVGGGIHATAWIRALPDIFRFFDRNTMEK